jgi:hypothetical protein
VPSDRAARAYPGRMPVDDPENTHTRIGAESSRRGAAGTLAGLSNVGCG